MQLHQFSRRDMLKLTSTAAVIGLFASLFHVSPVQAAEKVKKPLVVYFSMPETDNPQNMTREEENSTVVINGKVLGNTQYVAQLIQEMTDGDIFRILPQKPYPTDHRTLVDLAREEQEHAMKILKYLQDNGVKVELAAIAAPGADFSDYRAPLTAALKHEQYVTRLIHAIYKQARDSDDFRACQFLEWFVAEQGEEEKSTADLIAKFDLLGGDAKGLYLLNAELKNRA